MSTPTIRTTTRRLLDAPDHRGSLPRLGLDQLLEAVTDSGLTGRGGAGFPTAIKVRSVAAGARKPVVVGNGMEGEPLSHKDSVLLTRNPHLVLDGLEILARAMHAKRAILAVGPEIDPTAARAAARGRKVEVVPLEGGFIAGQETALVNQLDGRPGLPRDPFTRVTESGVGGRPTLVLNAETLAQVALVARHGAAWFRSAGTADDPGTSLFSVTGSVSRPGVVEADREACCATFWRLRNPSAPPPSSSGATTAPGCRSPASTSASPDRTSRRSTPRSGPAYSTFSMTPRARSPSRRRSWTTSPRSPPGSAVRA